MCIIAYSKKGHKAISDDRIKVMFENNPDGAGVMVKLHNGKTEWQKGYMNCADFISAVREYPDNWEIALHFRIATDGGIIPSNTHPFVVSNNMDDLRRLYGIGDVVMMHNGIIRHCKPQGGLKADCSDTMIFASRVLYPLKSKLSNPYLLKTLENGIDYSRLLIFRKQGAIMLGHWYSDSNGVYYSNQSYLPRPKYNFTKIAGIGKSLKAKTEQAIEQAAYYINGVPVDENGFDLLNDYNFEECY